MSTPRRSEVLSLNVRRTGSRVTANASGNPLVRWQLQLAGAKTVTAGDGVRITPDPFGVILQPKAGNHQLEFELT